MKLWELSRWTSASVRLRGRLELRAVKLALDRAGYGGPCPKKPRRLRGHGARLEERPRLKGLVGKLPRAVALRLPTTSNNLLSGRRDGRDVWGQVRCSLTLRDGALGVLAISGGLWVKHSRPGERSASAVPAGAAGPPGPVDGGVRFAAILAALTAIAGGAAFAAVEKYSVGEGIYWAITTMTTVGYGDITPKTTEARWSPSL